MESAEGVGDVTWSGCRGVQDDGAKARRRWQCEECLSLRRATEGVERTGAIASKNHGPGTEVLHTKTEGIKFNRTQIINYKLANRNKIFDDLWNDKVRCEGRGVCGEEGWERCESLGE